MPTAKTQATTKTRFPKKASEADSGRPAAELIDRRLVELQDWRGPMLAALRDVIRGVGPEITEEWKWNTPVWACAGIICTGETYKKAVKLTFAKGAELPDPDSLFNSSLEGNVRRAIDFPEGANINAKALASMVRAAVAFNRANVKPKRPG